MTDYPTWHRDVYVAPLPPTPAPRLTRAWRRLRNLTCRPGRNSR